MGGTKAHEQVKRDPNKIPFDDIQEYLDYLEWCKEVEEMTKSKREVPKTEAMKQQREPKEKS